MKLYKIKKMMCGAVLAFLLTISLAACVSDDAKYLPDVDNPSDGGSKASASNNEADIAGLVSEETGSMDDYMGWWRLAEANSAIPITYIEILRDNTDEARCYDKNGGIVDIGYTDYSEQRALNGSLLIVFTFDMIGEVGADAAVSADGGRWLDVNYNGKWYSFDYQETPAFDTP
jgi:hypothetical protein